MNNHHTNGQQETIREALERASLRFSKQGVTSPRLNAEVLMQHVMNWQKAKLFAEDRQLLSYEKRRLFEAGVERRLQGEPLQYIIGVQEFYGRDFHVNSSVLIPRPETEFLIEEVLKRRSWWQEQPLIADIGSGSGAIAVTLALEWPEAQVFSVDLSSDAIQVASDNARKLTADVQFLQGDLLEPLLESDIRVDILVSNPPYIPTADIADLMTEVRDYEPRLALDGGVDGLEPYRRMAKQLPDLMRQEGPALVCFEVGIGQAPVVASFIKQHWPGAETELVQDLQGIERVVVGWKRA